jgi:hypothetical protein
MGEAFEYAAKGLFLVAASRRVEGEKLKTAIFCY